MFIYIQCDPFDVKERMDELTKHILDQNMSQYHVNKFEIRFNKIYNDKFRAINEIKKHFQFFEIRHNDYGGNIRNKYLQIVRIVIQYIETKYPNNIDFNINEFRKRQKLLRQYLLNHNVSHQDSQCFLQELSKICF